MGSVALFILRWCET